MFKCFFKSNGLIAIAFCVLSFSPKAQVNLVPNPSFELLDSCVGNNNFITVLNSWDTLKAGGGFAIIFNSCYNYTTQCSVPVNANSAVGCSTSTPGSYQKPHFGNGYVYLAFFKQSPPNVAWRGYTQTLLTTTLSAGKSYCVTYYVSLSNRATIAIDELSAYFDNGTIQSVAPQKEAIAIPQIKSPTGVFYLDTLNWMKVQGTFTANGTESYITLGNFRTAAATNYTTFCGPNGVAEYYVDDVSVIDYNLPAYAGADQNIVTGDSAFVGRPPEIGLECTWTTGTTTVGTGGGLWVKPVTTTTYIVTQDICGNIKTDTVVINVSGVGISELGLLNNEIRIIPNPNAGIFNLEILNNAFVQENSEIKITNVLGQQIKNFKLISKQQQINLEEKESGVYYLFLVSRGVTISVKKIIKE